MALVTQVIHRGQEPGEPGEEPNPTCTPSHDLDLTPCLDCLSTSQLWMAFFVLMADVLEFNLPTDLPTILEASACYNCLSDKQMFEAALGRMANATEQDSTIAAFREKMKCLQCMDVHRIKAAIVYLSCVLWREAQED